MTINRTGFDYVQKHIPVTPHQHALLAMLRDSIQIAEQLAAGNWTLTCNKSVVRLNVGMIEVLVCTRTDVNMVVNMQTLEEIVAHTPMPCEYDGIFPENDGPAYPSVPDSAAIFVAPADAPQAMHVVRPAHVELIRKAARTKLNPAARAAHQAEVAQWVRSGAWA